jgi:hypothetical protein
VGISGFIDTDNCNGAWTEAGGSVHQPEYPCDETEIAHFQAQQSMLAREFIVRVQVLSIARWTDPVNTIQVGGDARKTGAAAAKPCDAAANIDTPSETRC